MKHVDIVIPVHNAAQWLSACLESICVQTHENFTAHFVLDRCTDTSLEILQQGAEQDPRIRVYSSKGQGILQALKTADVFLRGPFIHRMDSDDLMPPNKLHFLIEGLEQSGADFCTGKVKYFSEKEISTGYLNYEHWLNRISIMQQWEAAIFQECPVASANWLMPLHTFKRVGGWGDLYPEDYDLAFRWFTHNLQGCFIDQTTHLWRLHDHNTSKNDPNYNQKSFFKLKIDYLCATYPQQSFFLLGKGQKLKICTRFMEDKKMDFTTCSEIPVLNDDTFWRRLHEFKGVLVILFQTENNVFTEKLEEMGKKMFRDYVLMCLNKE